MRKTAKVAAVALAAALGTTLLAGCDISTNVGKDYAQTIAEVNITKSENFADSEYAAYGDVIGTGVVTKRDMVAYFVSTGYSMMQTYGWTYYDTFNMISETLVNRQIYMQYAMLYLIADESEPDITADGYRAAVEGLTGLDRRLASLAYFLDDDEKALALYSTRQIINNTLDSQESQFLDSEHVHEDETTVRTTPTGIDTEKEDYYKEAYRIYTGSNALAECVGYEAQDGSTPTTRRNAYGMFLAGLRANNLISSDEDVSKVENLSYFKTELATFYESAIIDKLTDKIEESIRATATEEDIIKEYNEEYIKQQNAFADDAEEFETALDEASDTSFVLNAPEANYGYVVNILIPFSASQSAQLENSPADYGDKKGNKFLQRAALLRDVTRVSIDDFIAEMEGYLTASASSVTAGNGYTVAEGVYVNGIGADDTVTAAADNTTYYSRSVSDYYTDTGAVDYSKFIYYAGKVEFADGFDANKLFVEGSAENVTYSAINELSFAYNTDTAGLNDHLGYVISTGKTDFVPEFEYAGQYVCRQGAGSYVVVPSDYGWHIIYCTFSFVADEEGNAIDPYTFNWEERSEEGTFSYLFYEAYCDELVSEYATLRQSNAIEKFKDAAVVYEDVYADLSGLDVED